MLFRFIQNIASHRRREVFFVRSTKLREKEPAQEEIAAKKEQTAGVMHKLTAAMHRNIFAVGLLGGKSAHVTNENAILDFHIGRKKGETNEQGSDRKQPRACPNEG